MATAVPGSYARRGVGDRDLARPVSLDLSLAGEMTGALAWRVAPVLLSPPRAGRDRPARGRARPPRHVLGRGRRAQPHRPRIAPLRGNMGYRLFLQSN